MRHPESRQVARPGDGRPDRLADCHGLTSFPVGNTDWQWEEFRDYILAAAAHVPGVRRQADIVRILELPNGAALSKWLRGVEQPSDASLRKIRDGFAKHGVNVSLRDMAQLTGRALEDEPGAKVVPLVEVDPHVARVAAVLAAKELTDEERGTVRSMLDLILPQLERLMRSRRRHRSA